MDDNFQPGRDQDAYAVFRGFRYQIQHTILAWLKLEAGSYLELECGEDIDHILKTPGMAGHGDQDKPFQIAWTGQRRLEQIKHSEENLTIRKSSALQSLIHFHQHIEANQRLQTDFELKFFFTTNARIGKERHPNPCGQKVLEFWNSLHDFSSGTECSEQLFLMREVVAALNPLKAVSSADFDEFQDFFANADDNSIFDFVQRFKWNAEAGGIEELEERIIAHCLENGDLLSQDEAAQVYSRLFCTVFNLLADKERPKLSRGLLHSCFDRTVSIPGSHQQRFADLLSSFREHRQKTALSMRALEQRVSQLETSRDPRRLAESRWSSWTDHFQQWLSEEKLFHHQNELTAREDEEQLLQEFLGGPEQIAVISGVGGMGKSRLLLEMARKNEPAYRTVFLEDTSDDEVFHRDMFEGERLILVIDDAHSRDEQQLKPLISKVGKQLRIKLVLATRPCGQNSVHEVLRAMGIGYQSQFQIELSALSINDSEKLAAAVLGSAGRFEHIHYLVTRADGLPLLIVGLAEGWKKARVPISLVEENEEFEVDVLAHLIAGVRRELPLSRSEDEWTKILAVIAAVQPFRTSDTAFVERVAEFLQMNSIDLHRAIESLADVGVMAVKGRKVAIKPDLVAERFLRDACISKSGNVDTGFATRILHYFWSWGESFYRILGNICSLNTPESSLPEGMLRDIWEALKAEFRGSPSGANWIIAGFRRNHVARGAPGEMFGLLEELLAHFQPLEELGFNEGPPYQLREAVQGLQQVAYHPEYLARVGRYLWLLGCNDRRTLFNNLDHGLRAWGDVIEVHLKNNAIVLEEALEVVEDLLHARSSLDSFHHPLEMLKPFFSKITHANYYLGEGQGRSISSAVIPQLVTKLWNRGLALIEETLQNAPTMATQRAAFEVLDHALKPCFVTVRNAPAELIEAWIPLCSRAMTVLEYLFESASLTPWHPEYQRCIHALVIQEGGSLLGERAEVLLDKLRETEVSCWERALRAGPTPSDFEGSLVSYSDMSDAHDQYHRAFVTGLLKDYRTPGELIVTIEEVLRQLGVVGVKVSESEWIWYRFFELDEDYSQQLSKMLADKKGIQARRDFLPQLLRAGRRAGAPCVNKITKCLVNGDREDQFIAAKGLGLNLDVTDEENVSVFTRLLHNNFPEVRQAAAIALRGFIRVSPQYAVNFIKSGPSRNDGLVWQSFFRAWWLSGELKKMEETSLTQNEVRELIEVIERFSDEMDQSERFSDHFIEAVVPEYPQEVFDYVMRQLHVDICNGALRATAFVCLWRELAETDYVESFLIEIANLLMTGEVPHHSERQLAASFWYLCENRSERGIKVISEMAKDIDKEEFRRLMRLVTEGPANTQLKSLGYIEILRRNVAKYHHDGNEWLSSYLLVMIRQAGGCKRIGEREPKLVKAAETIDDILADTKISSRLRRLYVNLLSEIEKVFEEDRLSDEELALR